jgi:hypothetical protein
LEGAGLSSAAASRLEGTRSDATDAGAGKGAAAVTMKLRLIGDEIATTINAEHERRRAARGAGATCVTVRTAEAAIGPLLKQLASRYDQVSLEWDRRCGDWRLSVSRSDGLEP